MKRFFAVAIVVFCVSGTISAADKQLLGLMMPDAKVLAGMNVTQVRNSPYGAYLLSQGPFNHPEFQQFVQAAGFDPLRDISELVAAATGLHEKTGLVAVRGTFSVAQIVSFVKTTGGKVDESQGVPMIVSPDGQMSIALVDSTLAMAGDPNSVTAALARRSAPSTLDPALVAKADALSVNQDAWAVTTITPTSAGLPPGKGPNGLDLTALQNIQQSSAGVKFGTSVNVTAEVVTDTAQNANALADVARLLVQLGALNPPAAEVATLLQNVSIQTTGTAVQVSLAIPENILEQMGPTKRAPKVRKVVNGR
jgi:hypothetical protein